MGLKLGASVNWYEFDSMHSIHMLSSYVTKIEDQVQSGIQDYAVNKKTEFIVFSEEERIGQSVEHYNGLDDMTWNLDELFKSHFPNLQRRSAVLTLYAFLEHELEKLCYKLKREFNLISTPEEINGENGINRS